LGVSERESVRGDHRAEGSGIVDAINLIRYNEGKLERPGDIEREIRKKKNKRCRKQMD